MKLKVEDIEFNLLLNESGHKQSQTPVIFLHGFTGDATDWQFILDKLPEKFFPVAIDLIGHGKTSSPANQNHYSCSSIVRQLNSLFNQLNFNKVILVGYSMGGRAALSYALTYPDELIAAVLESSTAGIEDFCSKKERVEIDFLLAEKIKNEGVESFINFWFDTPLFESLKNLPDYEIIKKNRIKNNVTGLANSLTSFSTGIMNSYWDKISSLTFPILLISGELDLKYGEINSKMKSKFQDAQHASVPQCGHNVHLEKPEDFTKLVLEFLTNIQG